MDAVVTVPKRLWSEWLDEGDLAYADDSGHPPGWAGDFEYGFRLSSVPDIKPEERVYIVAHGRLRGYAPLMYVCTDAPERFGGRGLGGCALVRRGCAIAVTLPGPIQGFQGFRYRWWSCATEVPFPAWRTEGVA